MIPRRFLLPASLVCTLLLSACATRTAARRFSPPTDDERRETLEALAAAQRRASDLPASRLLYDARISGGGPAVPGTLAVTYDGTAVRRASLTGPFGARVAEYDAGTVTGQDHKALLVDPSALRAVLAGVWPGEPAAVEGCDGVDCLAVWDKPFRTSAVIDRRDQRVESLEIEGQGGRLFVTYSGTASPWPQKISAREDPSGRSLKLSLVAVEGSDPPSPAP